MLRRMMAAVAWPVALVCVLAWVLLGDIFDDAWDIFSGGLSSIWGQIRNLVVGMFRHLINFVLSVVNFTSAVLIDLVNWSVGVAYGLFAQVSGALDWFVGVLWSAIVDVRNFAGWVLDTVVAWARGIFATLYGFVIDVWNTLTGLIDDVVRWVISNVWNPLLSFVNDIIHFVTVEIPNWVNGIVNNLWCFVKDVADSIANIAGTVFDDLIGPFKAVLNVALEAFKWLVFFALHPFDWFVQLMADLFDRGPAWFVAQATKAVEDQVDNVDGWLARFFE